MEILPSQPEELLFRRGGVLCHLNCGDEALDVPEGRVLICSGTDPGAPDTATWISQG